MRRVRRRWLEPTVVAVVSLLLVVAFVAAWSVHDGSLTRRIKGTTTGAGAPTRTAKPQTKLDNQLAARRAAIAKLQEKAQHQSHELATTPPVAKFVFAQFNTLGASHTAAGGKNARMAGGGTRGAWVGELFRSHHVGVGAVQEFQRSQAYAFLHAVGDEYAVWPGVSLTSQDGENSVVWRKDRFEALKTEARSYPYFGGHHRNFPRVLLRDKHTGVRFWVTSYHNPANTKKFGNQVYWKHRALSMEIPDVVNLIHDTGQPVIVSGDMNDRQDFFCPFARGTGMHSASGGSSTASGCTVPVRWIDWIMGTAQVEFSDYLKERSSLVARTSDHPIVLAQVAVTGRPSDRLAGRKG